MHVAIYGPTHCKNLGENIEIERNGGVCDTNTFKLTTIDFVTAVATVVITVTASSCIDTVAICARELKNTAQRGKGWRGSGSH